MMNDTEQNQKYNSAIREQNRQKYRVVLIDVDNTVLDFDAFVRSAMQEGFRKYHLPEYREEMFGIFMEINDQLWRGIEKGENTLEDVRRERWARIFRRLDIDFDGQVFENYFRAYLHECSIPVPGAPEVIRYLSDRYLLCAASNGPYEQQEYRLKISGLLEYFHRIFISEQVGASKPSARFFDVCMQELCHGKLGRGEVRRGEACCKGSCTDASTDSGSRPGDPKGIKLLPEEVMMVGDSLTADMDGAITYGMGTCFFDRKGTGAQGRKVDYIVTHMSEVMEIL